MSGWGMGWFGGGGPQKKEAPKRAILALRGQLEMLNKREKHLETLMAEQDSIARKNVSANKAVAKAALRRKKQHEQAREQTSGQINTLEREIYSIESANINKETLAAMKQAQQALKEIHGGITVDKVDQTMEELREQHAVAGEISEAITQAVGGQIADDDELEEELESLQQEALDDQMLKTGTVPVDRVSALPSAPKGVKDKLVQEEEEDEEAELRKLQAEMAM